MSRRRARSKRSTSGRVLEVLADSVLLLLILAFGISIAARFNPEKRETSTPARSHAGENRGRSRDTAASRNEAADSAQQTEAGERTARGEAGGSGAVGGGDPGGGSHAGSSDAGEYAGGAETGPEVAAQHHANQAGAGTDEATAANPGVRIHLTVDVRNGCGRVGLAEDVMQRVRRAGFDVVEYRNADRYDYAKTQIQDLRGNPQTAQLLDWLHREFGVGEIVRTPAQTAGADVRLVVGWDLADTLRRRGRAHR